MMVDDDSFRNLVLVLSFPPRIKSKGLPSLSKIHLTPHNNEQAQEPKSDKPTKRPHTGTMLSISKARRALPVTARFYSRMAYGVQRGPITTCDDPIHANQRVECSWMIRNNGPSFGHRGRQATSTTSRMEKIKICTPGLTLIRVKPELLDTFGPDVVAHVRMSSNAAEILQSVHLSSEWPYRTLFHFKPRSKHHEIMGNLVTEIDLPHANALRNLAAIGYGDVVIGRDVLVSSGTDTGTDKAHDWLPDEELRRRSMGRRGRRYCGSSRGSGGDSSGVQLMAVNNSRVFVDAPLSHLRLQDLKIATAGNGSQVFVDVAGLEIAARGSLDIGAAGGEYGRIAVRATTLIAPRIKIASVGTGNVTILPRGHVEVKELKAVAVGTGSIQIAKTKTDSSASAPSSPASPVCVRQQITSIGTSAIDVGGLQTQHAAVRAVGSGDVRVWPRDSLRLTSIGGGVLECVDRVPAVHEIRGFPSPTIIETAVHDPKSQPNDGAAKSGDVDGESQRMAAVPTMKQAFSHEYALYTPCCSRMW